MTYSIPKTAFLRPSVVEKRVQKARVLKTIMVPGSNNPIQLNVYSEHGPLLVTCQVGFEDEGWCLTHARTGFKFGRFDSMREARACAEELRNLEAWSTETNPSLLVSRTKAQVIPCVKKYGRL